MAEESSDESEEESCGFHHLILRDQGVPNFDTNTLSYIVLIDLRCGF